MRSALLCRRCGRLSFSLFYALILPVLVSIAIACAKETPATHYRPRTRELTVTTVPLLTKELQTIYPYLTQDFERGGVLEGKEVYTFVPNSLTVVQGDTVHFTLINPEDDAHSFVLPGLSVTLRPQSKVLADYIARNAGVFEYVCDIPGHLPFMYGQLVVLAAD